MVVFHDHLVRLDHPLSGIGFWLTRVGTTHDLDRGGSPCHPVAARTTRGGKLSEKLSGEPPEKRGDGANATVAYTYSGIWRSNGSQSQTFFCFSELIEVFFSFYQVKFSSILRILVDNRFSLNIITNL
jgi:hypothetical protein